MNSKNKGLILGKSKNGKTVFAAKDFRKSELLAEFRGKILRYEQFPPHYSKFEDHCVQIDKKAYLGPSGGLDDYFNHSCNPNSGLKIKGKKAVLTAIKNIRQGEEITWDYSTTMDEDSWKMVCNCGSKNCRKVIGDFKYLPQNIKNKYIRLGIVPKYLLT
ncbi:SET domain-containing protein-lysine N-methyltransferase [Candidatus Woesearchaeota archaeon]|nr:SET domain-containing protein-lysine N-methyltransferase [Candidatus Woesearchaeota archaeon]